MSGSAWNARRERPRVADATETTLAFRKIVDRGGKIREKWGIDQTRLVRKMQQMSKSTLIAIQEVCDRFWSHTDEPTETALTTAGVKVHPA
jgi:hypothetical protein